MPHEIFVGYSALLIKSFSDSKANRICIYELVKPISEVIIAENYGKGIAHVKDIKQSLLATISVVQLFEQIRIHLKNISRTN